MNSRQPGDRVLLHLSPLAAIGGCEMNCLRMIEGLPQYRHEVLVFDQPGPMSLRWTAAGAEVRHLSEWANRRSEFQAALDRSLASLGAPAGVFVWSSSRLPLVLDCLRRWSAPCLVHLGNPASFQPKALLQLWLAEIRGAAARGVTLVACSRVVAESHRKTPYFRRLPVKVIYNPVAPSFYEPRRHRELRWGARPVVGMVARLDPIKDHRTVIRAVAAVNVHRPDLVVEFAGEGALRMSLEQEAARLGVRDRVRFLGVREVAPLMRTWDAYVHSTTPAEGMGIAIAEAMAAGLPCVVTDLPVSREVCGNEAAYVRPSDAASLGRELAELLGDRSRRESLAARAQERARRLFSLRQVTSAYLAALGLPGTGRSGAPCRGALLSR